jgi:3-oxoacyl-[acyl-carrier protein] reductase
MITVDNGSPEVDLGIAGKTALVFGAAGGLGGAIARGLASEGANLVVADVNEEALEQTVADLRAAHANVLPLQWDLGNLTVVEDRIRAIEAQFGGVDILVNNTGCGTIARTVEQELPIDGVVGHRDH